MRRRTLLFASGILALWGLAFGEDQTRFRVVAGEATVGLPAQVTVLIVDAPAGIKAVEGVLTLEGAEGHIKEVRSSYEVQMVDQRPRTLRFRWLDLRDEIGRKARDIELLSVVIVPEEAGEMKILLSIPFLVTDTGASSATAIETEPLLIRKPLPKINEPPQANDDWAETLEGAAVTVYVIANDVDPDGEIDPATVTIVSPPKAGSAVVANDGKITYTPNESFVGTDAFTYTVRDDKGAVSNIATVTVDVRAKPSPPPIEPEERPTLNMIGGQWTFGQPGWIVLQFSPGVGGLRRLEMELMIAHPDMVSVTQVEWQGLEKGTWETVEMVVGQWRVRLADLFDQVQLGQEVRARIELNFKAIGTTQLSADSIRGLDDHGRPFTVPDLTVEVSCVLGSLEPRWGRPQDLDGDGLFEDLDGDGKLTLHDALLLAFHYDKEPLSLIPWVADFNGDGVLDFSDAQALAQLTRKRND